MQSSIWSSIKRIYTSLRSEIIWFIGANSQLNFWTDDWISPTFATQLHILVNDQKSLTDSVSSFLTNGTWNISYITNANVKTSILAISPLKDDQDYCVWKPAANGIHSVKLIYSHLTISRPTVKWHSFIWKEFLPPSRSFVYWRAILNCLPTDDNLKKN